ncbi:methyltransferase [Actinopolymorpha pittospori]|uniref:Aminoglycoside phosphotransferase (APT) family kinase protein n=1 Tax=Actinopolymorpha pittospori TaxID=648752 RepID=A0A927N1Y7_9ACTN|nr:methyltransferase [Actinopolymorpha pittospori]MBE1610659.1 aminoglycoside phosphotransferase (APT) family kinase protein [Actinopolymorpha pittospori]
MGGSYWETEPSGPSRPGTVRLTLPDLDLDLATDHGVFARSGVDRGTHLLLRRAPVPAPRTSVLDLGTGYGPIALATALRQPHAGVWAVDVNRRALALTLANAAHLGQSAGPLHPGSVHPGSVHPAGLDNLLVAEPAEVPPAVRFDGLYSNPPIKIGKQALHDLLVSWLARLLPGSPAWLVVKQAMGADSLQTWLDSHSFPTRRVASKQGYRLLRVTTPGTPPAPLAEEDLAAVTARTGVSWTVLGRLAGGFSDDTFLLGRGAVRAVLKIKTGEGWPDQLDRLLPVVTKLRALGYPTPEVLGAGPLTAERSFLMTAWSSGASPDPANRAQLDALLAAAELHREVHPPPERDWSAMVTQFLNGGISEHEFHPSLAAYTRRALALVPKPVPSLPTGDLVHGDLTFRNTLFDGSDLRAVIDLEGFGAGTVAIDLVSLLSGLTDPADQRVVLDRAVELSGPDVVAACLAHRVLAGLAWASEHPGLLPGAGERAERLLALAD